MSHTGDAVFLPVSRNPVPALGLEVVHYRHACGAEHWHLGCADEHRAFVVAFRTPPADSTGLPHILEHTTLCGSRRYPVRDPFFQMLRRSLQTFMNALTFPDLTAYPFATQVPKDFDNLLAVYLDAVFRPNLHPLSFAQEGHRLEPEGESWLRKGVVYNEMKGAMDSTSAQMDAARERQLLPDTIYRHNSGGEPSDIPRLRHQDLLDFHQRCYRPANACFITYGNADPGRLQASFAAYIDADPGRTLPCPEISRLAGAPAELDVPVPLAQGQDPVDATAIALTWVQGDGGMLDELLQCELLERLLLGHAGAPLRRTLEASALGRSIGHSGFAASYRNGLFTAELEGVPLADYPRFEPLVAACLAQVAREGFPAAEVDAALHQLELARREITGDQYPFGLELCFRLLEPWNYGVDPLPFLDQDAAIARLRTWAGRDGVLAEAVRRRLIDNPRRLLLRARPDTAFHAQAERQERAGVLADIAARSPEDLLGLKRQAEELARRQAEQDDPTVLPDLNREDIPLERRWAQGESTTNLTSFSAGTNGLLHHLVAFEMPALEPAEIDLLPLTARLIGAVGVGTLGYDEQAALINRTCGGIWAWNDIIADLEDETRVRGLFAAEVKGLASRMSGFLHLLPESLSGCRFDESARLRELVEEAAGRMQAMIQRQGNRLAVRAAMRGFGGAAALPHRLSGLGALAQAKQLAEAIDAEAPGSAQALGALSERLERLLSRLLGGQRHLALIGEAGIQAEAAAIVREAWAMPNPAAAQALAPLQPPAATKLPATAYLTATAVSYCALVFPVVGLEHEDAPALAVAGRLLTYNVLHPKLREQGGAYGGSASYQSSTAAFALSSYRDPRLDETFADMRESLRWLAGVPDDPRMLKEAVLGVIADLDSPSSPSGEARSRFIGDLKGVGPAMLNRHRAGILAVTPEQVRAAAARWLPPLGGSAAVVSGAAQVDRSRLEWVRETI